MKIRTALTLATTLLFSGAAFAQTYTTINLTGATAFRRPTNEAIFALVNSGTYQGHEWSNGANYFDADRTIYKGFITGVGHVIIRTNFRGSVEGIQDVVQQNDITFIPTTTTLSGTGGVTGTQTGKSNLAWADCFQGSTAFTSTPLTEIKTSEATPRFPGVVTFVFTANEFACNKALAPSQVANTKINTTVSITDQQYRQLATNGEIALSALTGNSADATKKLYLTGRYPGSGTRIATLACTGWTLSDPVIQYKPLKSDNTLVTSNADTIAKLQFWPYTGDPATTGDDPTPGNGGFVSSGNLRGCLGASFAATVQLLGPDMEDLGTVNGADIGLVAGIGKSDANNAAANGAIFMPYNGVSATDGTTSATDTTTKAGAYTFWGYEHLLQRGSVTIETNLAQKIVDNLTSTVGAAGFKDDATMTVKRNDDGSLVLPK